MVHRLVFNRTLSIHPLCSVYITIQSCEVLRPQQTEQETLPLLISPLSSVVKGLTRIPQNLYFCGSC